MDTNSLFIAVGNLDNSEQELSKLLQNQRIIESKDGHEQANSTSDGKEVDPTQTQWYEVVSRDTIQTISDLLCGTTNTTDKQVGSSIAHVVLPICDSKNIIDSIDTVINDPLNAPLLPPALKQTTTPSQQQHDNSPTIHPLDNRLQGDSHVAAAASLLPPSGPHTFVQPTDISTTTSSDTRSVDISSSAHSTHQVEAVRKPFLIFKRLETSLNDMSLPPVLLLASEVSSYSKDGNILPIVCESDSVIRFNVVNEEGTVVTDVKEKVVGTLRIYERNTKYVIFDCTTTFINGELEFQGFLFQRGGK